MMRVKATLLVLLAVFLLAPGALPNADAADNVRLSFGRPGGEKADIIFSSWKRSAKAIVIKTTQVGVAGSRLFLEVDKRPTPIVDHILAESECRFGDNTGSCEIAISGLSAEYRKIVRAFRRGRTLHIGIVTAGAMKMSEDVSLSGFKTSYGRL